MAVFLCFLWSTEANQKTEAKRSCVVWRQWHWKDHLSCFENFHHHYLWSQNWHKTNGAKGRINHLTMKTGIDPKDETQETAKGTPCSAEETSWPLPSGATCKLSKRPKTSEWRFCGDFRENVSPWQGGKGREKPKETRKHGLLVPKFFETAGKLRGAFKSTFYDLQALINVAFSSSFMPCHQGRDIRHMLRELHVPFLHPPQLSRLQSPILHQHHTFFEKSFTCTPGFVQQRLDRGRDLIISQQVLLISLVWLGEWNPVLDMLKLHFNLLMRPASSYASSCLAFLWPCTFSRLCPWHQPLIAPWKKGTPCSHHRSLQAHLYRCTLASTCHCPQNGWLAWCRVEGSCACLLPRDLHKCYGTLQRNAHRYQSSGCRLPGAWIDCWWALSWMLALLRSLRFNLPHICHVGRHRLWAFWKISRPSWRLLQLSDLIDGACAGRLHRGTGNRTPLMAGMSTDEKANRFTAKERSKTQKAILEHPQELLKVQCSQSIFSPTEKKKPKKQLKVFSCEKNSSRNFVEVSVEVWSNLKKVSKFMFTKHCKTPCFCNIT